MDGADLDLSPFDPPFHFGPESPPAMVNGDFPQAMAPASPLQCGRSEGTRSASDGCRALAQDTEWDGGWDMDVSLSADLATISNGSESLNL